MFNKSYKELSHIGFVLGIIWIITIPILESISPTLAKIVAIPSWIFLCILILIAQAKLFGFYKD